MIGVSNAHPSFFLFDNDNDSGHFTPPNPLMIYALPKILNIMRKQECVNNDRVAVLEGQVSMCVYFFLDQQRFLMALSKQVQNTLHLLDQVAMQLRHGSRSISQQIGEVMDNNVVVKDTPNLARAQKHDSNGFPLALTVSLTA